MLNKPLSESESESDGGKGWWRWWWWRLWRCSGGDCSMIGINCWSMLIICEKTTWDWFLFCTWKVEKFDIYFSAVFVPWIAVIIQLKPLFLVAPWCVLVKLWCHLCFMVYRLILPKFRMIILVNPSFVLADLTFFINVFSAIHLISSSLCRFL